MTEAMAIFWAAIIAAVVSVAGFLGQQLSMKWNHDRELEKIAFEKRYKIYADIVEAINKNISRIRFCEHEYKETNDESNLLCICGDDVSEEPITVYEDSAEEINYIIRKNEIIISDKIKREAYEITKDIKERTYQDHQINGFIASIKKELRTT